MAETTPTSDQALFERKLTVPLVPENTTRIVHRPVVPAVLTNVPFAVNEREYTCVPLASRITSVADPLEIEADWLTVATVPVFCQV